MEVSPQLYFPSIDLLWPQLPLGQPETLSLTDCCEEVTSQENSNDSAKV